MMIETCLRCHFECVCCTDWVAACFIQRISVSSSQWVMSCTAQEESNHTTCNGAWDLRWHLGGLAALPRNVIVAWGLQWGLGPPLVAVCCSVLLQCVAVYCNVLQCVSLLLLMESGLDPSLLAVCCSVWQCDAMCCSSFQSVAECYSVFRCVATVCCIIVAHCCSRTVARARSTTWRSCRRSRGRSSGRKLRRGRKRQRREKRRKNRKKRERRRRNQKERLQDQFGWLTLSVLLSCSLARARARARAVHLSLSLSLFLWHSQSRARARCRLLSRARVLFLPPSLVFARTRACFLSLYSNLNKSQNLTCSFCVLCVLHRQTHTKKKRKTKRQTDS